ncbi:Uncharacterised protein [Klebsiella michiganensis]|uniref:Uncharacterized protein n=1 Tax=Klebsiella michiganensis TaxID=1134687 RepID=A0A7H4NQ87_9ENTR|nr:Uncharacterised protein [Klebsiella michiganensis]SAP47745.1 Uncharacterised protein [Klebsiella michiganensis]SAQ27328.1 Uncharacterised protein [Klebsiella michiganensis]STR41425.1 Uncharacterised protein [Klebsiella michiganensis]STV79460.1 Uncharacterised protein [Klebsiella michiganensis]
MRDAALRIHPRVARVILLSFFLRMLSRDAVADKGK